MDKQKFVTVSLMDENGRILDTWTVETERGFYKDWEVAFLETLDDGKVLLES